MNGNLLESAAARIAAVGQERFEVLQYFRQSQIQATPGLMQKIFPNEVLAKIQKKIDQNSKKTK